MRTGSAEHASAARTSLALSVALMGASCVVGIVAAMPHPPRQNRVAPSGEVVAIALRGAWLGNRGILHDEVSASQGRIVRHHAGKLWITCALSFRGWRAAQWAPHHYTPLFFHDEAVALAAGHRPCALCRRAAYAAYRDAVARAETSVALRANEIDARLHAERLLPRTRTQRRHRAPWTSLPDGTFVLADDGPALVRGDRLVPWSIFGYAASRARPRGVDARVLTPPTTVTALKAGYRPQMDAAAGG